MAAPPIRVLVADDEPVLLEALADLIGSDGDFELVGSARDASEAISLAEQSRPDVALVDVRMPNGGGLRVAEELRDRLPEVRVIAHTAVDDRATVVRLLNGGAVGYLVKGTPPAEILGAIRRAARGQTSLSPEVMSGMVSDLSEQLHRDELATSERRDRIERISRAIEGHGRTNVYQPIMELDGHAVVGMEALARFATEPILPPDRWFAEAAEVGLGPDLELACDRVALADLARLPRGTYLSINASRRTAESSALLDELDAVDASRVVIEITEHEAVDDYDALSRALGRVRERGSRIAIDDAGAGFASLRHILLIDPEIIKIDVSLTRNIDSDAKRRAISSALITFGDEMGMTVVAEGIETLQEHETLRELGVRFGQGFYLGHPAALPDG